MDQCPFAVSFFQNSPLVHRKVVGVTAVRTGGVTSCLIPDRFFTNLDAMFVYISMQFIARDFHIEFLKFVHAQKTIWSHLNETHLIFQCIGNKTSFWLLSGERVRDQGFLN